MNPNIKENSHEELSVRSLHNRLLRNILIVSFIFLIAFSMFLIPLKFTGFVVSEQLFTYTKEVNLSYSTYGEYELTLEGKLRSLSLDGNVLKHGRAAAYLEAGNKTYLVFDSTKLTEESIKAVTGLAVSSESGESLISINLEGGGLKAFDEVFRFNISSNFAWNVNYAKLCAKWDINDISLCYGSEDCCALVNLKSSGVWNDSLYLSYGRYDSGLSNKVKAQVIYANYSLDVEHPYSDIIYSDVKEAEAYFREPSIAFTDICIDTCLLPELNYSSYRLIFVIENTTLSIDSISYSVNQLVNVSRNAPELAAEIENMTIYKDGFAKINLSGYFYDKDGDKLSYAAYEADNISAIVLYDNLLLVPSFNFTGRRFMYIAASDGYYNISSNLFYISVIEKPSLSYEVNVSEEVIKPKVVINAPVKWVKKVNASSDVINLSVDISPYALNVTVIDLTENKTLGEDKLKVNDNGIIKNASSYRAEKRIGQIEKAEDKLEIKKEMVISEKPTDKKEISLINNELLELKNEKNSLTGYAVAKGDEKGLLTKFLEWLFNFEFVGYSVYEPTVNETSAASVIIEDIVKDAEVEYYTEGPSAEEELISNTQKKVTVSSGINYTDILSFSELEAEAENVKLYWVNESRYVNFTPYDTNNNSLIDYIEWVIPHLSSQVYIIESSGSNTTLKIWDETDTDEPFGDKIRYAKQLTYFFANYSNKTSGNPVNGSGIFCNITFSDGRTANMSYDSSNLFYSYGTNFSLSGNYSYNVTCDGSALGYSSLNTSDNVTITQLIPGFAQNLSVTGVTSSSLAWADIDNDGDWDLVYTGSATGLNNIQKCANNNGLIESCSNTEIEDFSSGSLSFGDIDNDGDLDLAVCGNNGSRIAKIYKNDGLGIFTFDQDLTGVDSCSIQLGDYNKDGLIDLVYSGTSNGAAAGGTTKAYIRNTTSFRADQNLTNVSKSSLSFIYLNNDDYLDVIVSGINTSGSGISLVYSNNGQFNLLHNLTYVQYSSSAVADLDNDGDLDLILAGTTNGLDSGRRAQVYKNNGTNLNFFENLFGVYKAALSLGDYNNDGLIDLVAIGDQGSNNVTFYRNNGTNLVDDGNYSLSAFSAGSISLFDYDGDGDLDLAVSGGSDTLIYNNNASLSLINYAPSPPTILNSTFDGTWLNLTWNNGTDELTPQSGLYYNIKIGTKPYTDDIISGKYGGSSNPSQGYIGNVMQLHNYAVNVSNNKTYFWQVQTIDNGLKLSNWSSLQKYDPCPAPSNSDWNITVDCVRYNETIVVAQNKNVNIKNNITLTLINSTLLFNQTSNGASALYILEGGINISNSNISSVNSYSYSFFVYNNSNISITDSYISKAGFADNIGQRGLEINGTVLSFQNNVLNNNYVGITFYSNNNKIRDSTISGSLKDILSINSNNNTLLNITFTTKNVSSSYINVQYYLDVTVNGNGSIVSGATVYGYNSTNSLIDTKTSNSNGIARIELTQYVDTNNVESTYNPYTITATADLYISNSKSVTLSGNNQTSINLTLSGEPYWNDFKNSLTTNFTNLSSWTNLSNVTIGIPNKGLINFSENINITNINLSKAITIGTNSISLDVSTYPQLNKSAVLTIFNLSYMFEPVVLKDNVVCPSTVCKGITYSNYNLTFNVTGFSTYSSASNSKLNISIVDNNNKIVPNETVYFYANYSNRTSGLSINGSLNNCSISFNGTYINMTFNTTTYLYEYNRTFPDQSVRSYTQNYNVSCIGNFSGYENINYSSSFTVKMNVTLLDLGQSLEGVYEKSSLVLGDLNNDSRIDLIVSGYNDSLLDPNSLLLGVYTNNNSNYSRINNGVVPIVKGSLGLIDYDKDGDLDVSAIGDSTHIVSGVLNLITKIFKNE